MFSILDDEFLLLEYLLYLVLFLHGTFEFDIVFFGICWINKLRTALFCNSTASNFDDDSLLVIWSLNWEIMSNWIDSIENRFKMNL